MDRLEENNRQPITRMQSNALAFFDATQGIHALPQEFRSVLSAAIWLEEIDFPVEKKDFLPAMVSRLRKQISGDLSQEGEQGLTALVGLRTKKIQREDLAFLGFSPQQQRAALTLAAILDIIQQLERSKQKPHIQSIKLTDTDVIMIPEEPLSQKARAKIQRKSGLWQDLGFPPLQVFPSDEAGLWLTPYPELSKTSGISAGDTLGEAGRKTMRFLFAHMLVNEEGTRRGEDIEALHDMRVATRRLRAAFEVYDAAFEKRVIKPHLNGLRQTGRALGAVRDLDVFMEKAQKYISGLPEDQHQGLDPLLEHWVEQREEARARMLAHLNSREYAVFKRNFNIFLNSPGAGEIKGHEGLVTPVLVRQLVPILVYERMASVRAFETHLDGAPTQRLHLLRIEFKKLRYTLEYFVDVLGKQAVQAIDDIKKLQDHLGDLNDADVASQILGEFLANQEKDIQVGVENDGQRLDEVVGYLKYRMDERERLMNTFISAWNIHFQNRAFRRNIALAVSVL